MKDLDCAEDGVFFGWEFVESIDFRLEVTGGGEFDDCFRFWQEAVDRMWCFDFFDFDEILESVRAGHDSFNFVIAGFLCTRRIVTRTDCEKEIYFC